MTLLEVIQDIHALNAELETFESKYGVLSEDFYQLYAAGRLRDEEPDEIIDYGRWSAFYQTKTHRLEIYRQLFEAKMRPLRESDLQTEVTFTSPAALATI